MLCPIVHRISLGGMDILAQVLDRVRLGGTLLFHFELGHPWNLALPERPYALFHYLSRGSATLARVLFEDMTPAADTTPADPSSAVREEGAGRPTKRERRDIDRLLGRDDFGD